MPAFPATAIRASPARAVRASPGTSAARRCGTSGSCRSYRHEDLADIAAALGIDELRPEWIGANLLLGGIPHLSLLPPRTLLIFESGATVRIDGDNGPCKKSGKAIAAAIGDRPDIEFGFVAAARQRRGLVGWVEREGLIRPGDTVTAMTWRQTLYPG